ncbi:MAG: TMEM175 family protein [Bacteroidota bacterium]
MLRRALFDRGSTTAENRDAEDDFQWRGEGVSRLENLSDIVFAFAISFLVATAETPETFDELVASLIDLVGVGLGFAILLFVWHTHYIFFRRYGLEDGKTVLLNGVLLFLILVYVYPLQFLFSFQVDFLTGQFETGQDVGRVLSFEDTPALTAIYAVGYGAVFGVFTLLYRHALRRAEDLGLSPVEHLLTRERIALGSMNVGVAVAAILLALVVPAIWSPVVGLVYFAIWPLSVWIRKRYRREMGDLTS